MKVQNTVTVINIRNGRTAKINARQAHKLVEKKPYLEIMKNGSPPEIKESPKEGASKAEIKPDDKQPKRGRPPMADKVKDSEEIKSI